MTIHDMIVSRLIVESLAKNGNVTLEEAKFFTDFSRKVLNKLVEETINELNELNEKNVAAQEINESAVVRANTVDTKNIAKKLINK
jgi:hypothetical protein